MTNKSAQNRDYEEVVTIQSSRSKVFKALTSHINQWWGTTDKIGNKIGQVFTVSWGEPWYQFEIQELVPDKLVQWKCIDANQIIGDMEGVQKEWIDTILIWRIQKLNENELKLHFLHKGLTQKVRCYEVCSAVWNRFINQELKNYLET